jgi:hypothetical protein
MRHVPVRKVLFAVGLLSILVLLGCRASDHLSPAVESNAQDSLKASMPDNSPAAPQAEGKTVAGLERMDGKPPAAKLQTVADSQPDRYLIKNATLKVETSDPRKALEKVTTAIRASHGYVSDMHESVDSLGARSVTMTVRIPATDFDQSMLDLQSLGKVLERQVTAEDVTEEYVDSQARLRNLKKTEERLIEHLTKTGKLSDTLLVEKELTRVRQEIEQIEGRLRFLSHRIAFSTITLTLSEAARSLAMTPPEHYSTGKVTTDAVRSLVGFAQEVWSFTIWMAVWAIVWIPILLIFWFVFIRIRKAVFRTGWQPGPPVH